MLSGDYKSTVGKKVYSWQQQLTDDVILELMGDVQFWQWLVVTHGGLRFGDVMMGDQRQQSCFVCLCGQSMDQWRGYNNQNSQRYYQ